jgi:5'-nucleotidase
VVDLKINLKTRDVVRDQTVAHNEIVTRDVTPDLDVANLVDEAKTKAAPIANRKVGTITADLPAAGGPRVSPGWAM